MAQYIPKAYAEKKKETPFQASQVIENMVPL